MKYEILEMFSIVYAAIGGFMLIHLVSLLIYGPREDIINKAASIAL